MNCNDASIPPYTVLAFDYGVVRIGVAVGNTLTRQASPLKILRANSRAEQVNQALALIQEWQAKRFVVGQPKHANGAPHEVALQAAKFARQLTAKSGVQHSFVDETLSSQVLDSDGGMPIGRREQGDDHLAAAVILQQFFNQLAAPSGKN